MKGEDMEELKKSVYELLNAKGGHLPLLQRINELVLTRYCTLHSYFRGEKDLFAGLDEKAIGSYWFATGTPTYLIRQLQRFRTDITSLDDIQAPASAFGRPTEAMTDALPLLY